ncbi:MAG: hypothetical protein BroJett026_24090 [Betaproteobacteria bacterium]|nr:MAG: hypothetical protein BroJett026_24090 [Betaproteobacteria bacterium]
MHEVLKVSVLAAAFAFVPAAHAAPCAGFDDVDDASPFCASVAWMKNRAITLGCGDGSAYCPDDAVTRLQMAAFMKRLGESLFPLTCGSGQLMKWNGADWACANDATGSGTVTSVAAGTGLEGSPNPITGAGSLNLAPGYQLPQGCGSGQVAKANGSGGWTCASDVGSVTSVTAGNGLSGGTITTSGTIAADTDVLQRRVTAACAAGSSIRAINGDGTVVCETDDGGGSNAFVQGGNAFGAIAVLGTTDTQALDLRVGGARAMRYEPAISPNVVGGHGSNIVDAGVRGATVGGGGIAPGTDPGFGTASLNRVTDAYGTVGGGTNNRAGNASGSTADAVWATVAGGGSNVASGAAATVGGGGSNVASGTSSTVSGGNQNQAAGSRASVAGGEFNSAAGDLAAVGGGQNNTAPGFASAVTGGRLNTAGGTTSQAGGYRAKVRTPAQSGDADGDEGTFLWADTSNFDFPSTGPNQFRVRATGGVAFVTQVDGTGAATRAVTLNGNGELDFGAVDRQVVNLRGAGYGIGVQADTAYFRIDGAVAQGAAGGFSWYHGGVHAAGANDAGGGTELMRLAPDGTLTTLGPVNPPSDRRLKTAFAPVDAAATLARVLALPITTWAYRSAPQVRHVGPTAQDFRAAFGLGRDDTTIATVDADGVALAAIQGLNAKLEARLAQKDAEIAQRDAQIASLSAGLADLRRAVDALRARLPSEASAVPFGVRDDIGGPATESRL